MDIIRLKAIIADASNLLLDEIQGGVEQENKAIAPNVQLIDVLAVLVRYNKLLVGVANENIEQRGDK